jgi:hypothetical protein
LAAGRRTGAKAVFGVLCGALVCGDMEVISALQTSQKCQHSIEDIELIKNVLTPSKPDGSGIQYFFWVEG